MAPDGTHYHLWSILMKQQQKNTSEFGQAARFYQFTEINRMEESVKLHPVIQSAKFKPWKL